MGKEHVHLGTIHLRKIRNLFHMEIQQKTRMEIYKDKKKFNRNDVKRKTRKALMENLRGE